jgi:Protein SCAI
MLLSPSVSPSDLTRSGSLFTYFLTAPLQAFCHLVGLNSESYEVKIIKNNQWHY